MAAIDVVTGAGVEDFDLLANGRSRCPQSETKGSVTGAMLGSTSPAMRKAPGSNSLQEPEHLRRQGRNKKAHARDIGTRPVDAGDEAQCDCVAASCENKRYRRGCGLGRERSTGTSGRDDHGDLSAN
jgi:hypothetical protein